MSTPTKILNALCAVFLIAIIFKCQWVKGDELSLIAGSWSTHVDADREYNEEHESVGLKYTTDHGFSDRGFNRTTHSVFTFINSYNKRGYAYLYGRSGCDSKWGFTACLGFAGGATTGYEASPVVPVAGATGDISYEGVNLNIMFVPIANVITYQLDATIWRF